MTFLGPGVRIRFPTSRMQRVFSDYTQLESRFGAQLAARIATRLAVLEAAKDLERVPRRPPIRLRALNGSPGRFSVDLLPPHRLTFSAVNSDSCIHKGRSDDVDRAKVEEIEVLGVE